MNNRIAIFLGHPAHFYLFKNVATKLRDNGHIVDFLIKRKDILEELLRNSNNDYFVVRKCERKTSSKIGLLWSALMLELNILLYLLKYRPRLLVGTCLSISARIAGVPVIVCNEDDADIVPNFVKISYPNASAILVPTVCDCGKWNRKATKYNSYHEFAYLHPNNFSSDRNVVEKYFSTDSPYFIMRFAKLSAHHDAGINGINANIAQKIITLLEPYGKIFITSERLLEPQFEKYRININPLDMHHIIAFADLYIGDSQTMAAESGVLGVPFIRFNDFVGKIGYLRELEEVYLLGYGIKTDNINKLFEKIIIAKDLKYSETYIDNYKRLLADKIDASEFISSYLINYPNV